MSSSKKSRSSEEYDSSLEYFRDIRAYDDLMRLVEEGNVEYLQKQIDECKITKNDIKKYNNRAIIKAACKGYFHVISWINEQCTLFDNDIRCSNNYVIYSCCQRGTIEDLKWLFETFNFKNIPKDDIVDSLVVLSNRGDLSMIKYFIEYFESLFSIGLDKWDKMNILNEIENPEIAKFLDSILSSSNELI